MNLPVDHSSTRGLLVCVHDATPAFAAETDRFIELLEPLLGSRFAIAVVPDWHGAWPIDRHPGFCRSMVEAGAELLLHGHRHQRQGPGGAVSLLTARSDELAGLSSVALHRCLTAAQARFAAALDRPARGLVAPAWQHGDLGVVSSGGVGLDYLLGYFNLIDRSRRRLPLATWSWDCGRFKSLGLAGHLLGWLRNRNRRIPSIAVHPRDLARGYWPRIERLLHELLAAGHEPITPRGLLDARAAQPIR